jgi:hypothetical protein
MATRALFAASHVAARPFHTTQHRLPDATNSVGRGLDPLQLHQSVYVVAQVHHADRAHDLATHRVLLVAEHVLDAGAHFRARRVGGHLRLRQGTVACPAPVNAALQAPPPQLCLDLGRAVSTVGPNIFSRVVSVENIVEVLAVMRRGVGGGPLADELVRLRSGWCNAQTSKSPQSENSPH